MRRGIVFIIIGVLLLVVIGVGYAAFSMGLFGGGSTPATDTGDTPTDPLSIREPEPQPTVVVQTVPVVVAVQNIGRGMELTADAVTLWDWPVDALPPDAFTGSREDDINSDGIPDVIEQVLGLRMRSSVVRFEPILSTMLADRIDLSGTGSDAALAIPNGRVLMAFPLLIPEVTGNTTSGVAYALRPGDHVDVMLSLALVDLDEEFHTKLNNEAQIVNIVPPAEGETGDSIQLIDFTYGRIEEGPLGLIFNIIPGEDDQRPRLVTQLTVQDAIVVRVGRYPTQEEEILGLDPLAPPTPTPVPEDVPEEEIPPSPPPQPVPPDVILLALTPQEALVLKFAWEMNADIDMVLRPVGDQALYQTTAVTLQYLMETYNIGVPPKLQYGVEPPVFKLDDYSLLGNYARWSYTQSGETAP